MKKEYIQPSIKAQNVELGNILAGSVGVTINNGKPSEDNQNNQFVKHTNVWETDED